MSTALKKGLELYKERQFLEAKAAQVLDPSCLDSFKKHLEDAYKNNDLSVLSYVINSVDSLRYAPEFDIESLSKDPLFASFTNILSPRKLENKDDVPNIFENENIQESKQDFLENFFKNKSVTANKLQTEEQPNKVADDPPQSVNFVLK